jgi:tetratricopeptide (TPR) repeat protein
MQRKMTKWSLVFIAVIIPTFIIFVVLIERQASTKRKNVGTSETFEWFDVDQSVGRGELDKAIQIGEKLIVKTPLFPEAHHRLAGAYLAAGNCEKARQHYEEAFCLFPSEANANSLAAIDRRTRSASP